MLKRNSHRFLIFKSIISEKWAVHMDSFLTKLEQNNGKRYTAQWLKTMWQISIHLKNKDSNKAIKLCHLHSISHKGGIPKGHIGLLIRLFLQANSPKVLRKFAGGMRIYTSFIADVPKNSDLIDIRNNIEREQTVEQMRVTALTSELMIRNMQRQGFTDTKEVLLKPSLDKLSPTTSTFVVPGLVSKIPNDGTYNGYGEKLARSILSTSYHPDYNPFWGECPSSGLLPYMDSVNKIIHLNHEMIDRKGIDPIFKDCPGKLTVLQEKGFKYRTIAVPNALIQASLEPVHQLLDGMIKRDKNSCVHDQLKGLKDVKSHIDNGGEVWSFDLSNATERFPWTLQSNFLDALGLSSVSNFINEICMRPWYFEQTKDFVGYGCGQPMGMYGSFPIFHLTHLWVVKSLEHLVRSRNVKEINALLETMNLTLKKNWLEFKLTSFPSGLNFYILGDDIIISDPTLAQLYERVMEGIGVPISPTKSLYGRVVEFAGFLFLPRPQGSICFRPYKFPKGKNSNSEASYMWNFGKTTRVFYPGWITRRDVKLRNMVFWRSLVLRREDLSVIDVTKHPGFLIDNLEYRSLYTWDFLKPTCNRSLSPRELGLLMSDLLKNSFGTAVGRSKYEILFGSYHNPGHLTRYLPFFRWTIVSSIGPSPDMKAYKVLFNFDEIMNRVVENYEVSGNLDTMIFHDGDRYIGRLVFNSTKKNFTHAIYRLIAGMERHQ